MPKRIGWISATLGPGSTLPAARFLWILLSATAGALMLHWAFHHYVVHCPFTKDVCHGITNSPPWAVLAGLVTAPAVVLTWWWRTVHKDRDIEQKQIELSHKQREVDIAKREERSKRFADAVRMLADEKLEVRLGAIYSLESLAVDAAEELARVKETLCAFVRFHGKLHNAKAETSSENPAEPPADVQEAFRVLGRMQQSATPVDLRGAVLASIDASGVSLVGARLQGADLRMTQLQDADLRNVNLQKAKLQLARLIKADLRGADLQRADLKDANLRGADLRGANLFGVAIGGTNFQGARYSSTTVFDADVQPAGLGMDGDDGSSTRAGNLVLYFEAQSVAPKRAAEVIRVLDRIVGEELRIAQGTMLATGTESDHSLIGE